MTTTNTTMEKLTLENVKTWEYRAQDGLDVMENLKLAHDQYDYIQNQTHEVTVFTIIKMGEIYKKAKSELASNSKNASNQTVAEYFEKSESTVRSYMKIFDNKEIVLSTPMPELLGVGKILAILNGRAVQNADGTVEETKPERKTKQYYIDENKSLKEENKTLQSKNEELEKELIEAKIKIADILGKE